MKGNFIYVAASAVLGIVIAHNGFDWKAWLAGLTWLALLAVFRDKRLCLPCALCIGLFAGLYYWTEEKNTSSFKEGPATLIARITDRPSVDGDRLSSEVKSAGREEERLILVYRIKKEEEKKALQKHLTIGLVCRVQGKFVKPSPGVNPHAFDYSEYLHHQRVHWLFNAEKIDLKQCIQGRLSLKEKLLQIRSAGLGYIERHFPPSIAGFVQALVLGERDNLDGDLLSVYQSLGLIHLIAISGLNIALISGLLFFIGIRLGIARESVIYLLLAALPIYMVLAGAEPSVVRAVLMSMTVLIGLRWRKKVITLDSISIVCMLMMAANPYSVFNVGFQLSFIVTLALILSSSKIFSVPSNSVLQMAAVTVVSQLSALPILLLYFYEISLLSLPLNLLYVPFFSVLILPMAMAAIVIHMSFPPAGELIISLLALLIEIANELAMFFSRFKAFTLTPGIPGPFLFILYYAIIIAFFVQWEKRRLSSVLPCFVLFVAVFSVHWNLPRLSPFGEVSFLDVGQGDSILIDLPYRKAVYLIDTGGVPQFEQEKWQEREDSFNTGTDVILPYLKAKGIRKIDKLILTHGDFDHVGSAWDLVEQIKIDELLIPPGAENSTVLVKVLENAKKRGITVNTVQKGSRWLEGDIPFYILSPEGEAANENDGSIVLYTALGGKTWLFTGDLEEEGERMLLRNYPKLTADILKVGHHGSSTSTSDQLLNRLNPETAVISVGRNNRYSHPAPAVLKRLRDHDIKTLRTDLSGGIVYEFWAARQGTFTGSLP